MFKERNIYFNLKILLNLVQTKLISKNFEQLKESKCYNIKITEDYLNAIGTLSQINNLNYQVQQIFDLEHQIMRQKRVQEISCNNDNNQINYSKMYQKCLPIKLYTNLENQECGFVDLRGRLPYGICPEIDQDWQCGICGNWVFRNRTCLSSFCLKNRKSKVLNISEIRHQNICPYFYFNGKCRKNQKCNLRHVDGQFINIKANWIPIELDTLDNSSNHNELENSFDKNREICELDLLWEQSDEFKAVLEASRIQYEQDEKKRQEKEYHECLIKKFGPNYYFHSLTDGTKIPCRPYKLFDNLFNNSMLLSIT